MTGEQRAQLYNCSLSNGTYLNGTCLIKGENTSAEVWSALVNASKAIKFSSPSDDFFKLVHLPLAPSYIVSSSLLMRSDSIIWHLTCSNYMLDVSDGFHEMGGIKWQLALCFLFAWIVVFLSLAKGIKVSGKVSNCTESADTHTINFHYQIYSANSVRFHCNIQLVQPSLFVGMPHDCVLLLWPSNILPN